MNTTATAGTPTTMQELLAQEGVDIKVAKAGDVLEGTVLSVGKNEVFLYI